MSGEKKDAQEAGGKGTITPGLKISDAQAADLGNLATEIIGRSKSARFAGRVIHSTLITLMLAVIALFLVYEDIVEQIRGAELEQGNRLFLARLQSASELASTESQAAIVNYNALQKRKEETLAQRRELEERETSSLRELEESWADLAPLLLDLISFYDGLGKLGAIELLRSSSPNFMSRPWGAQELLQMYHLPVRLGLFGEDGMGSPGQIHPSHTFTLHVADSDVETGAAGTFLLGGAGSEPNFLPIVVEESDRRDFNPTEADVSKLEGIVEASRESLANYLGSHFRRAALLSEYMLKSRELANAEEDFVSQLPVAQLRLDQAEERRFTANEQYQGALEILSKSKKVPEPTSTGFVQSSLLRIGAIVLVLYLAQILVSAARYNAKVSNSLFGKAQALQVSATIGDISIFNGFANALSNEEIEFGKMPKAPSDKLADALKAAIDKIRPG